MSYAHRREFSHQNKVSFYLGLASVLGRNSARVAHLHDSARPSVQSIDYKDGGLLSVPATHLEALPKYGHAFEVEFGS